MDRVPNNSCLSSCPGLYALGALGNTSSLIVYYVLRIGETFDRDNAANRRFYNEYSSSCYYAVRPTTSHEPVSNVKFEHAGTLVC